jgi:hypothetical protein
MGDVHRLTDPNERRVFEMTASELKRLVAEGVAEAIGGRDDGPEQSLTAAQFGKLHGTTDERVRQWCKDGMPHYMTGNQRGLRIYPSKGSPWVEENRG